MSFSNIFGTLGMFPDVDRWVATLNRNHQNAPDTGFRATRTTFNGAPATSGVSRNAAMMRPSGNAQISLAASTELDMSQGLIQATGKNENYAIAGDGFFVLEDRQGNLFYTRDGEFSQGDNGTLVSREGLSVVTRSRLVEKGLYAPVPIFNYLTPTPTPLANASRLIDRGLSDWQYASDANIGADRIWFPYATGTAYDEGTSYVSQSIALKKTFSLGDTMPTNATISIGSDDWTYLYINGNLLTRNDSTPATTFGDFNIGGPTSGIWLGQGSEYDVSKYLRPGINTITAYSSEDVVGEGVSIVANFNDFNGNPITTVGTNATDNRWMTKIIGQSGVARNSQTGGWPTVTDDVVKTTDVVPLMVIGADTYSSFDNVSSAPIRGNLATITQDGVTYVQNTDYKILDNQTIGWLSTGSKPTAGSTFQVTFTSTPVEPGPTGDRYDALFEQGVTDLAIARFGMPSQMRYSKYGPHLLEATTDAGSRNFEFSSAAEGAKVRRGYLEQANTNLKKETYELALAQKMYDAITSLTQLQFKAMDSGLNIIK